MPNQQILDYVAQSRRSGINDEQIKQSLLNSGWPENEISEALLGNFPSSSILNKPKTGLIVFITVIVLVLAATASGYFYWRSSNKTHPVAVVTKSPSTMPSLSASASVAPTNASTTPSSTGKTGPVDYGTNIGAFITAAQTCTPSKATVTTNISNGPGVIEIMVETQNAQILGSVGQNCHFFSTLTDFNLSINQELANNEISSGQMTQAQLDATKQQLPTQINSYKKALIGATTDCTFSTTDLVSFLQFWQSRATSSGEVTTQFNTLMTKYCKTSNPNEVIIH
jgi:hypothetical protein